MIKIIFKTIWNHLRMNKTYAAINIAGLAIGIGCSLVIYKIITYESSFDSYHKNHENIYRLIIEYNDPKEGIKYQEGQVPPVGEAIRNEFPGVDAVMTFYAAKDQISQISIEDENGEIQMYQENKGVVCADPNIFEVFDFNFLAGDPSTALLDKGNVVITSSLAQKYFGLSEMEVEQAMNRFITINNIATLQVSGVISDPPKNTDLPFTIIANYYDQIIINPYFRGGTDWQAGHSYTNCYLLLQDNISVDAFEEQLLTFYDKYHEGNNGLDQRYVLQPLSELHSGLCNNYNDRQVPDRSLLILGIIGLFLILMASINFINLSTVQATKRFKEIGVKKIFGENKYQSILQFLLESVSISYIAAFIGLFIAHFILIYLENILGYRLDLGISTDPQILIKLFLLATIVGLLSGLYPSIIIARMSANVALKKFLSVKNSSVSLSLRRILVVVQFTISLILIIGTLVMNQQLEFFLNKDLGFKKDAIILATLNNANEDKLELLKSKLLEHPEIEMVSYGTRSPLADWKANTYINYPTIAEDEYTANIKSADVDYMKLYELEFIAGQSFSNVKNNAEVVVNRKLTELLGFNNPQESIGEIFEFWENEFIIVGVVEDFHSQSLQKTMENVVFSNLNFNINEMSVRINPKTLEASGYQVIIDKVQKEWDEVFPDEILNYSFLDEKIATFYSDERNTSKLIQLFAIIAILIGSLGLFGLISYIISQKTQEISIRKINGAKISEILILLNKDFMIYLAIAFIIAVPIAYYATNNWLKEFAYKIELSWWIFAIAGLISAFCAIFTVSWQTYKASIENPIKTLKNE